MNNHEIKIALKGFEKYHLKKCEVKTKHEILLDIHSKKIEKINKLREPNIIVKKFIEKKAETCKNKQILKYAEFIKTKLNKKFIAEKISERINFDKNIYAKRLDAILDLENKRFEYINQTVENMNKRVPKIKSNRIKSAAIGLGLLGGSLILGAIFYSLALILTVLEFDFGVYFSALSPFITWPIAIAGIIVLIVFASINGSLRKAQRKDLVSIENQIITIHNSVQHNTQKNIVSVLHAKSVADQTDCVNRAYNKLFEEYNNEELSAKEEYENGEFTLPDNIVQMFYKLEVEEHEQFFLLGANAEKESDFINVYGECKKMESDRYMQAEQRRQTDIAAQNLQINKEAAMASIKLQQESIRLQQEQYVQAQRNAQAMYEANMRLIAAQEQSNVIAQQAAKAQEKAAREAKERQEKANKELKEINQEQYLNNSYWRNK